MTAAANVPSRRWVELAAAAVLLIAALEEANYVRQRMARTVRWWWDDFEHREQYGIERSTLDTLAARILFRRVRT